MRNEIIYFFFMSIVIISCQNVEPRKGSAEHIKLVTEAVSDQSILEADQNQGNWLSYSRNYKEDRYSNLKQITKQNVDELGLAWSANLGTKRGIQSTPIVVDGILFFTGPWSVVYAYDARTGDEIWKYDPNASREKATDYCCGVVNRGLAIYEGDLFVGTLDGRLISIDASTGMPNWEVLTIPDESHYSITGAPRIVKGNVVIGNGGAEFDARGYVTAYNTKTGEETWRFYTVPGDPSKPYESDALKMAADTWTGDVYWKQGGGGTAWDAIVYDPKLNLVYIGVGNGTHWDQQYRSPEGGDNLFLSSIVALNADDGTYQWHFQTTPGDTWDYTATQPIILADLEIEGEERKVLMQAPKNGFFYVIDRVDGSFISADNFVYQNWASGTDENGRPIENEGVRYKDGRTHWIAPSTHGGHNWFPMSYNHKTGLVYIPTAHESGPFAHIPKDDAIGHAFGAQVSMSAKLYLPPVIDPKAPLPGVATGRLIAWDPIAQKEVWGVNQKLHYNGGILSTETGLVFQGDAEGKFIARNASTGDSLWEYDVRSGVISSPVTYLVDGIQYITLLVGWGGSQGQSFNVAGRIHPGTIYTFKIGGDAEAPAKLEELINDLSSMTTAAEPIRIGQGFDLFTHYCIGCHMTTGSGGGAIPDLARSSDGVLNSYNDIILKGMLAQEGMPDFGEYLSEQDVADIKSFVLYTAQSFKAGMPQMEYMTNLAQWQYMADQTYNNKAIKD